MAIDAQTKQDLLTMALLMKKAREQEEAKKREKEARIRKWKDEDVRKRKEAYLAQFPPEERAKRAEGLIIEDREPLEEV